MSPNDKPAVGPAADSQGDDLVWPPPPSENDILWLRAPHGDVVKRQSDVDPRQAAAPEALAVHVSAGEPASPLLSLSTIAGSVALEWHDAVALVQQLADELVRDVTHPPAGSIRDLGSVKLSADGSLRATLDVSTDQPLFAGLAGVLRTLLHDRPAPPNLRAFAEAMCSAPADASLCQWTAELARWERPGRSTKLVSLYERNRNLRPARQKPAAAPVPLDSAVRQPSATVAEAQILADVPQKPRGPNPTALMALAGFGCVVGGSIVTLLLVGPSSSAPVPASKIDHDIALTAWAEHAITTPIDDGAAPYTAAAARVANPGGVHRTSSDVAPDRTRRSAAALRPPVVAPTVVSPSSVVPPRSTVRDADVGTTASRSLSTGAARETPLFQAGDDGVLEPVLLNPYIRPRARDEVPDGDGGVLEVVVDTRGQVESVRLNSAANRYRDKWWLFTAKGWRFQPATKDGKPVRFLKRIALSDLNTAGPP